MSQVKIVGTTHFCTSPTNTKMPWQYLQSLIVFHLTGLILFAGTSLASQSALRQFWKQYNIDRTKAVAVLQARAKFPLLMGLGFGLIILSGVGMMAITHGAFGEQLWFRIKFGLVILILINGIIERKQQVKLAKTVINTEPGFLGRMKLIKGNLQILQYTQLLLLFLIILLSVFKFN